MPEEEKKFIPPEAVEDVEKAEEGAYAEKPYRDALAKYEENLTPEQKQALDWIASKEGEAAIKAFEEKKGEEDPRIAQLRENALNLLKINDELLQKELGDKLGRVQEVLNSIGMSKAEDVLRDEGMRPREKVTKLNHVLNDLHAGVKGDAIDPSSAKYINNKDMLAGHIARQIGEGDPGAVRDAMKALAYFENKNSDIVTKEYLPYINNVRKKGENAKTWDEEMAKLGYMWVEKKGEYMSLEDEGKKE